MTSIDKIGHMKEWKSRPAFTIEQLIQIYEGSGRSTNLVKLKEKASELYPDINAVIYLCESGFSGFDRGDGMCEKPVYTIGTHLCRSIAILKNGEAVSY